MHFYAFDVLFNEVYAVLYLTSKRHLLETLSYTSSDFCTNKHNHLNNGIWYLFFIPMNLPYKFSVHFETQVLSLNFKLHLLLDIPFGM